MRKLVSRRTQFATGLFVVLGLAPMLIAQQLPPKRSDTAKPRGAGASRATAPSAGNMASRIDAYVQAFAEGNNFSGVIYASRGGKVLFEKGYGMANYEFAVPNTPQTRFHIASVSKSFTAAAILLLEEQGKLSTADAVTKFLPDYPNGEKILLEHLLTHCAGIPNVNNFPEYQSASRFPQTAATLVALFRDKPLDFEPGTRFRYSNSNYVLLALIIEKVSGQSYGEFLKANIFDSLGLKATAHDGDATQILSNAAAGTEPEGLRGVKRVPYLDWSSKTGNGSLLTTTGDLCRFAGALFGGKLLKPASLAKVMRPGESFPYGWTDRERSGHKAKGVGGRSPGFIANVEYSLDDGTCVAILSNSYSSVAQVIAPDISALVYGKAAEPGAVRYVQPRGGQLAEFTGRFQMPENYYAPRAILTLQDRGGYLEATWSNGGTTIIYPADGDNFVDRTNWAMVQFVREEHAQITGFTYKLLQDFKALKLAP